MRREGDSNPRYSHPYGSLANCWFQPLTHLSFVFGWCKCRNHFHSGKTICIKNQIIIGLNGCYPSIHLYIYLLDHNIFSNYSLNGVSHDVFDVSTNRKNQIRLQAANRLYNKKTGRIKDKTENRAFTSDITDLFNHFIIIIYCFWFPGISKNILI